MTYRTLCAESFADIVGLIYQLDEAVGRPSVAHRWWFRGQKQARWPLVPSGQRGYDEEQERSLSNEFRARAATRHPWVPQESDYAAWLALMQHYGLPTRLLDWSWSPLIAAYFATEAGWTDPDRAHEDSAIWALAPGKLNEDQGFRPYLFPLDNLTVRPLLEPALKGERLETGTVIAAMTVERDARHLVQQTAFTVHSGRVPLDLLPGAKDWLVRVVIRGAAVPKMAFELHRMGYTRGSLFPDLGSLATQLSEESPPGRA